MENKKKKTPATKEPIREEKKEELLKSASGADKQRTKSAPSQKANKAIDKEKKEAAKRLESAKTRAEKEEKKMMHRAHIREARLEKKAALKKKKLERKELLARKKAERKAMKLERKAALRERKLEKLSERKARREMLKNESKAERRKRLAQKRKEKLSLRRQKAEARTHARDERRKARNLARQRRAEDRRHKREQKKHAPGFGGWLAAVISLGVACLALATVVTAGGMRMNEMTREAEGGYRATLYEMVSVSEDLDDSLSKLRVSSGNSEQRKLLTNILVDAALLESALERIPVDAATSTDISAFVNKTGSYARTLLSRLAQGRTLNEKELETVTYLYRVNDELTRELNSLSTTMTGKEWGVFVRSGEGSVVEKFGEMASKAKEKPEEIVEAPFAEEGNVGENKLLRLKEVSEGEAEELLKGYFSGYHIKSVAFTGETVSKELPAYNFVLTDEGGAEYFAEVSKNGGKLVFFDGYTPCKDKNFELETCDGLAREFLATLGIEEVEAVWLSDAGLVADITYVATVKGVRCYPAMIRVRVCEEKGRVIGMEARGYLLNGGAKVGKPSLSEGEAREKLSSRLEAEKGRLALIPVEGKEVLSYEFYCRMGEEEFVVYIDARSGEEVEVFRVEQSAQGSYLR